MKSERRVEVVGLFIPSCCCCLSLTRLCAASLSFHLTPGFPSDFYMTDLTCLGWPTQTDPRLTYSLLFLQNAILPIRLPTRLPTPGLPKLPTGQLCAVRPEQPPLAKTCRRRSKYTFAVLQIYPLLQTAVLQVYFAQLHPKSTWTEKQQFDS